MYLQHTILPSFVSSKIVFQHFLNKLQDIEEKKASSFIFFAPAFHVVLIRRHHRIYFVIDRLKIANADMSISRNEVGKPKIKFSRSLPPLLPSTSLHLTRDSPDGISGNENSREMTLLMIKSFFSSSTYVLAPSGVVKAPLTLL